MAKRLPSHEVVDYRTRPNKGIERKMIIEALNHFHVLQPLSEFKYIGFGGLQFADFELVHRAFGVKDMLSIEAKARSPERIKFNVPLACIRLVFEKSTDVLGTEVPRDRRSIVWLDYDGHPQSYMLTDMGSVARAAPSGSVIIVTVNAEPRSREADDEAELRDLLREEFGPEAVDDELTDDDVAGWKQAAWYYPRLLDVLTKAISDRNAGKTPEETLEFVQLFHFTYADGKKMLTLGGVIVNKADKAKLEDSGLMRLPFVRPGTDAMRLQALHLTLRELHALNLAMPHGTCAEPALAWMTEEEKEEYRVIYRYYPKYFDILDA